MKQVFTFGALLITVLLMATQGWAQAPAGMNYQAILRSDAGAIISNDVVEMRFRVRNGSQNGQISYEETSLVSTNEFGLVNHVIGQGTTSTGTFAGIDWTSGAKFLQVEVNTGSAFVDLGAAQLMSVPYAMHSKTTDSPSPWTVSGGSIYSNNSGNVGIGTSNPSQKLTVSGSAQITGTTITSRVETDGLVLDGDAANPINMSRQCIATGDAFIKADVWSCGNDFDWLNFRRGNTGVKFSVSESGQGFFAERIQTGALSIEDMGNFNLGLQGDVIPYANATSYDLGNNNTTEHWDEVVANSFVNFSDRNTKENIQPLQAGLSTIMLLNPVKYQYKPNIDPSGDTRFGLIAQDVQAVLPEVVVTEDVDVDPESGEVIRTKGEYLAMNYIDLIPVLIKAVQEQQAEIEELKRQLEASTLNNTTR